MGRGEEGGKKGENNFLFPAWFLFPALFHDYPVCWHCFVAPLQHQKKAAWPSQFLFQLACSSCKLRCCFFDKSSPAVLHSCYVQRGTMTCMMSKAKWCTHFRHPHLCVVKGRIKKVRSECASNILSMTELYSEQSTLLWKEKVTQVPILLYNS